MKRIFCILSLVMLFGCGQQEGQTPQNLVPEYKMVQILADVHVAEARIEHRVHYPDTALMVFNQEERRILEAHGVAEQDFRDTYRYYLHDLRKMDKLYEIILDTLSVREAKLQAGAEPSESKPAPVEPAAPPVPVQPMGN